MCTTIALLILIVLLLLICTIFKWNFGYWSKHPNVPSVPGRIFSANLRDVFTMRTNFNAQLKVIYEDPQFQNEAAVGVYGAYKPSLLIREPQLIKRILITEFDSFHDRFVETDPIHDALGNKMLFFARYPIWREMRLKFNALFSSGKLKNIYPITRDVCENLEQCLVSKGDRFVEDIWNLSSSYIIDVLASFIGIKSNALQDPNGRFPNVVHELGQYDLVRALNYLVIFFIPRLSGLFRVSVVPKKFQVFLKSYFENALKEREQSKLSRNDVVDICLKYKREFKGTESEMKAYMDGFTSQATIFLMGGAETTTATLSYTLLELAKHPAIQQRLRSDIIKLLRNNDGDITWESLNKLEYMECVINETLRLYPSLPFVERKYRTISNSNFTLDPYYPDYTLPDGMPVYVSIAALNFDPKYWPNPTKFDPERFSTANKKSINSDVFLPFGDGPRNCIGARLGKMAVKASLVYILKNHQINVCDRTNVNIEFNANATTLQPIGGIYLEICKNDTSFNK